MSSCPYLIRYCRSRARDNYHYLYPPSARRTKWNTRARPGQEGGVPSAQQPAPGRPLASRTTLRRSKGVTSRSANVESRPAFMAGATTRQPSFGLLNVSISASLHWDQKRGSVRFHAHGAVNRHSAARHRHPAAPLRQSSHAGAATAARPQATPPCFRHTILWRGLHTVARFACNAPRCMQRAGRLIYPIWGTKQE